MQRFAIVLTATSMIAACGNQRDDTSSTGSGSASVVAVVSDAAIGSADPPVALGSDGLPVSCGTWRAALDKLKGCTAFPDNARSSLESVYADVSKNWGQLPIDAKKKLGLICQSGADSVLKGAKATCGW
ncbi:MAG TPA: hypothetical protein VH143_14505 [Kofleriaceae bacterium]|jgi:hypothetical protein|nr:hypothetical protein [Kofleriaceae bacterium]